MDVLSTNHHSKIKSFWQKKEYRAFPIEILRSLREDVSISDGAALCWIALFEKSFFQIDWKITISTQEIAEICYKSSSSVTRYLQELESSGWLIKTRNKSKYSWKASTLQISIPQTLVIALDKENNREKATAIKERKNHNKNNFNKYKFSSVQYNKPSYSNIQSNANNKERLFYVEHGKGGCPKVTDSLPNNKQYIYNKYIYNNPLKKDKEKTKANVLKLYQAIRRNIANNENEKDDACPNS